MTLLHDSKLKDYTNSEEDDIENDEDDSIDLAGSEPHDWHHYEGEAETNTQTS